MIPILFFPYLPAPKFPDDPLKPSNSPSRKPGDVGYLKNRSYLKKKESYANK